METATLQLKFDTLCAKANRLAREWQDAPNQTCRDVINASYGKAVRERDQAWRELRDATLGQQLT